MKIGIVTMISENYGNRLQNYALQHVIENLGFQVETFHNPFDKKFNERRYRIKRNIRKIVFFNNCRKKSKIKREYAFEHFNAKYISWSKYWLNKKKHLQKIPKEFCCVICGSDQIWNPESNHIDGRYFGSFMPEYARLSYAASFGLEDIPMERKKEWEEYLKAMENISVRENTGLRIVREIAGREGGQHVDPTLLLRAEEWLKISKKPNWINTGEKYVLTYFLGNVYRQQTDMIGSYAKETGCKVISLNNEYEQNSYICDPSEFLYLIKNAEAVFTDSFHGIVFSIIFHIPVQVYQRQGQKLSMNSRLDSLAELLGIELCAGETEKIEMSIIDYDRVEKIIGGERKKALLYLREILRKTTDGS